MDKVNSLSLPATIIISSVVLGGFYFVSESNKQQSIERQKRLEIEQARQERLEEQWARERVEEALNVCIANAEGNYFDVWYEECKALGRLTNKCIDVNELSYDEYIQKYGLTHEEYAIQRNLSLENPNLVYFEAIMDFAFKRQQECSCRLPSVSADRIEESLHRAKDACLRRHSR